MFYSLSGFFTSFGKNPNHLNFIGVFKYLFVYGIPILAREIVRVSLVKNTRNKSKFVYIIIALVISISEMNVFVIGRNILIPSLFLEDFLSIILPIIIKNIVFTFIAEYSNILPGILYCLSEKLFLWCMPIYPNIPWVIVTMFDSILLITLYLCIQYTMQKELRLLTRNMLKQFNPKKLIILMIIGLIIFSFSLGILYYSPYSILSNSMYPYIEKGDIVIIEKCDYDTLKIGDIVQYRQIDKIIVHRIVEEIYSENGERYFVTKGDNNDFEDEIKVNENIFLGKVIFKIKYLGWPSIWIKEFK